MPDKSAWVTVYNKSGLVVKQHRDTNEVVVSCPHVGTVVLTVSDNKLAVKEG